MVWLYKMGPTRVPGHQALRIQYGLGGFRSVFLDFDRVAAGGQAFGAAFFRARRSHPDAGIVAQHAEKT